MKLPRAAQIRALLYEPQSASLRTLLRAWEQSYTELCQLPRWTPDVVRQSYMADERQARRALVLAGLAFPLPSATVSMPLPTVV